MCQAGDPDFLNSGRELAYSKRSVDIEHGEESMGKQSSTMKSRQIMLGLVAETVCQV